MDLWRPVSYRNVQLNNVAVVPGGSVNTGVAIDRVVFGGVPGVGYTEKRSLSDGRDASDIYLESRRIVLQGTIYGTTRAEAFSRMAVLRTAMSPTGAFVADPSIYGYLPLYWQEPTTDTRFDADEETGIRYRSLHANVRPLATPEFDVIRDRLGGVEDRGSGIPWTVQLEAIDPRIYGDRVTVYLDDTDNINHDHVVSGPYYLTNRGGYPAPVRLEFTVAANQVKSGFAKFTIGGSIMRIGIPKSTKKQTIRYDGIKKVLTIEENGLEVLRMDQLRFLSESTHPLVPAGTTEWTWTTLPADVVVPPEVASSYAAQPIGADPTSRIWFDEAYV